MQQQPLAAGQFLIALDWYLGPVDQVAVIGRRSDSATARALAVIRQAFRPRQVLAIYDPDAGPPPDLLPWLAGKVACQDTVTVYRCREFQCQSPLIGPERVEQAFRQEPWRKNDKRGRKCRCQSHSERFVPAKMFGTEWHGREPRESAIPRIAKWRTRGVVKASYQC